MIYRRYNDTSGPACLNFELDAIFNELNGGFGNAAKTAAFMSALTGLDVPSENLLGGLTPSALYNETRKAADIVGAGKVVPIIQSDDELLAESIAQCGKAGAETVSFFMWRDEDVEAAVKNGAFKKQS